MAAISRRYWNRKLELLRSWQKTALSLKMSYKTSDITPRSLTHRFQMLSLTPSVNDTTVQYVRTYNGIRSPDRIKIWLKSLNIVPLRKFSDEWKTHEKYFNFNINSLFNKLNKQHCRMNILGICAAFWNGKI